MRHAPVEIRSHPQLDIAALLIPPVLGTVLLLYYWSDRGDQWLPLSLLHPLGSDEFGRDILASVIAAAGFSLLKGIVITVTTLLIAVVVAELVSLPRSSVSFPVRVAASVIESIPIILWVLIVIIAVPGPRIAVVGFAFALVVLPIATNVIAGELFRVRATAYVEAAYQLGASESRVILRYILPNATGVLLPFALQILGAAIAVDGAIGVIGLGNRSDLDLGIFLLRGKESFFLHPQLLTVALAAYVLLYSYLLWTGIVLRRISTRGADNLAEEVTVSTAAPI